MVVCWILRDNRLIPGDFWGSWIYVAQHDDWFKWATSSWRCWMICPCFTILCCLCLWDRSCLAVYRIQITRCNCGNLIGRSWNLRWWCCLVNLSQSHACLGLSHVRMILFVHIGLGGSTCLTSSKVVKSLQWIGDNWEINNKSIFLGIEPTNEGSTGS